MNFVTTVVYWGALHKVVILKPEFQGDDKEFVRFARLYVVHSVPFVVCIFNTYLTNSVLSMKLMKVIWIFCPVFGFMNYLATIKSGKAVYWIMPWDPIHESVLVVFGIIAATSLMYILFVKIDEFCKYEYLINAL